MANEREEVGEYVEESITILEAGEQSRVFDENMLRNPLSLLELSAPVVVEPHTSVLEAVKRMEDAKVGCVLVAGTGKLKGIFTERDVLLRIIAKGQDAVKVPVRQVMTANPESLRESDSIAYALNLMSIGGYRHIPLIDNSAAPIGAVSMRDIVNYLVRFFPQSILNLPTLPRGNYTREREGA